MIQDVNTPSLLARFAQDLVGAEISSASRHQPVFVNEATEPVGSHVASDGPVDLSPVGVGG